MKIMKRLVMAFLLVFIVILGGFRYVVVPHVIKNHHAFINFNKIQFPKSPNYFYSPAKKSRFNVSVITLQQRWNIMIAKQPRVTELASKENGKQRMYVQLSAFWHFPDFIDVKFISLGSNRSSIAVYSRSRFGYSDFGVNKKRVKTWLLALDGAP